MQFSVCIPVYNTSQYLETCLNSVLRQRGAEFEVILLDDGSTDSSGAICDRYAARYPNIRVIHKANEGLLATRRRGFLEAKGDWLICVDSDDYLLDNHLQTIADVIGEHDCDMVMFDYESVYPDGRVEISGIEISGVQIWEGEGKQEIYEKRLLKNKYNNMWSKAIKRSVLDLDTDYSQYGVRNMCEDAIQSYELYTRAGKIVYVPRVLYAYRRNIASITAHITMDYWHAIRVSMELGWKYVKQWEMPATVIGAYGARCISSYCDFLTWLLSTESLDDTRKKAIFNEVFLDNKWFALAAEQYRKEYLATKYLRLRNPVIVDSICRHRSWKTAKLILQAEKILRRKSN